MPSGLSAVCSMNGGTAEARHDLGDPAGPGPSDVSTHLTTAGRETDQRGVVKVGVLE